MQRLVSMPAGLNNSLWDSVNHLASGGHIRCDGTSDRLTLNGGLKPFESVVGVKVRYMLFSSAILSSYPHSRSNRIPRPPFQQLAPRPFRHLRCFFRISNGLDT